MLQKNMKQMIEMFLQQFNIVIKQFDHRFIILDNGSKIECASFLMIHFVGDWLNMI
jgi:hypothetical protein